MENKVKSRIMYIELKGGGISGAVEGAARIGRVTFSKTGKSVYYGGRVFMRTTQPLKANYFDQATGETAWISGCRKDGQDALYPLIIDIDDDVREEYWTAIREQPERVSETRFRSEGKHTQSGPR
jgi:hypothetical protein